MCCTAEPTAYTKDHRDLWGTYSFSVATASQTAGKKDKDKDNAVDNKD
jgi:hypothetical protein